MVSTQPNAGPARAPGPPLAAESDSARRRARDRRRVLLRAVRAALVALVALAVIAGGILALRPKPVPVDLARVERGPLVVTVQESGMTRVKDRYVVSAPVTGSLHRLVLEPNDEVREGDVLAKIAPAPSPLLDERTRAEAEARLAAARSALLQTEAQVKRAQKARELTELELERSRFLAKRGAIVRQELDQVEFEARMRADEQASAVFAAKVASDEVRRARAALARDGARAPRDGHVEVVAPVSGRVLRVHQESAAVVQSGSPLLEIGDPEALEVVVDLLTTDAVNVRPGTPVTIEGWGQDRALNGRVRQVELAAFTRPSALGIDEQRVNVIIAFTDAREHWAMLGDGYRAEVRLLIWEGKDVLKAPLGAVFRHGNRWAVFRVEAGHAARVPVEIGHRGDTEVEIVSGLDAGDAVVVHPGDRVKDGVKVESR